MNLVIDTQTLKSRLDTIADTLNNKDADPIAGHYLFRVGPDWCEVLGGHTSTGLCGYIKITGIAPTNVDDEETVEFTCNGAKLIGFLGAVGSGNLNISYDSDTKKITIKPDSFRTKFNTSGLNPGDSFNFEADYCKAAKKGGCGTINATALFNAFGMTSPFIGEGMAQAGFGLVNFTTEGGKGIVRTADGKSVAVYSHTAMGGSFDLKGDKVNAVAKFINSIDGDLTLIEGQNYFFLADGGGNYFGFKKVTYGFPTMDIDVFTEDLGTIVKIDKSAFKGALNRLRWSLEDDWRRMKFHITKTDDGLGTQLTISTKNVSGATSDEVITDGIARVKGDEDVDIYLNYKYLLNGLDKFGDVITLYVNLSSTFSYVKLMDSVADNEDTITKVLFLALMKRPR